MSERCVVWAERVPAWEGRRTGAVSDLAGEDAAAARVAIRVACDRLRELGCEAVLGPVRGDTWHEHRVVIESDGSPAFYGEPAAPAWWANAFRDAGFGEVARYASAATVDVASADPRMEKVRRRFEAAGLTLRPLDPDRLEADLRAMHGLCTRAFARNFLYRPLGADAFVAMYQPLAGRLVPGLVELAEAGSEVVGLSFALPDPLGEARGEAGRAVVLKTLARRPGRRFAGLGSLLVQQTRHAAAELGFSRVVHAMMHEHNDSLNLATGPAGGHAAVFRRYALFGRVL